MFPSFLLVFGGLGGYVYLNNDNDNFEYWRNMQSGGNLDDGDLGPLFKPKENWERREEEQEEGE